MLHNGIWGTVCGDNWDAHDGQVVCRQLSCGTVLSVSRGARHGEGAGPIWLDEVNCTGTEAALSECQARPWGQHDCVHMEDASVECSGRHNQPAVWGLHARFPSCCTSLYTSGPQPFLLGCLQNPTSPRLVGSSCSMAPAVVQEEWRCSMTKDGAPSAMMAGTSLMLMWCAGN